MMRLFTPAAVILPLLDQLLWGREARAVGLRGIQIVHDYHQLLRSARSKHALAQSGAVINLHVRTYWFGAVVYTEQQA